VSGYGRDGRRKDPIWEGWRFELDAKLDGGFPEMFNPLVYLECHLITGWETERHPCHWHLGYMYK